MQASGGVQSCRRALWRSKWWLLRELLDRCLYRFFTIVSYSIPQSLTIGASSPGLTYGAFQLLLTSMYFFSATILYVVEIPAFTQRCSDFMCLLAKINVSLWCWAPSYIAIVICLNYAFLVLFFSLFSIGSFQCIGTSLKYSIYRKINSVIFLLISCT